MAATAAARTNAILKVKAGGRIRLIVFDTQDLTIGRATENDISVDDPEMSRRHAVFKRSREGCAVEDMNTSNGTAVNGQPVKRAILKHGDVVRIGEVEITFAETARAPSTLGSSVEYASQLKAFGTPMARVSGDGGATILGMLDAPTTEDDGDFEVRPAGEFDFDLGSRAGAPAPRDLDADLDADFSFGDAKTHAPARAEKPAPARKPERPAAKDVWELDEAPASAAVGPLSVTLEIDGLTGELRRAVEALIGKVVELPKVRVRIKGRELG